MRKVTDLTVEELRDLIATTVWETLQDFLGDPDEGLELQDWVKERLRKSLEARLQVRKESHWSKWLKSWGLSKGAGGG
jgi:hypothetical protein